MEELILRNIPAGVLDKLRLGDAERERLRRVLAGIRMLPCVTDSGPRPDTARAQASPGR